jgi:hypothetical protein
MWNVYFQQIVVLQNMKNYKWLLLSLFVSLSMAVGAVSLPSQSYLLYNELYEPNQDNVSMSYGTVFKGINTRIMAKNASWGEDCYQEHGEGMDCHNCCGEYQDEYIDEDQEEYYEGLYKECLKKCGEDYEDPLGGAPLDLPVWFILPLCGLYGAVQRIRNRKKEAE